MSVVSNVQKLYKQVLGGVAPSGAANSAGDISQMVKYLIANPSSPSWQKLLGSVGQAQEAFGVNSPFIWSGSAGAASGPSGLAFQNTTESWDNTNKAVESALGNAAISKWELLFIGAGGSLTPWGVGGKQPAWNNASGVLVPPATLTTLVMEWAGKYGATQAAADNGRGVGITNSTIAFQTSPPFTATLYNASVWRKTGSGWTLSTADGTTKSDASEAADTSDANLHVFRIEIDGGVPTVRFYVDGVLKITKATNFPGNAVQAGMTRCGAVTVAADAAGTIAMQKVLVYLK